MSFFAAAAASSMQLLLYKAYIILLLRSISRVELIILGDFNVREDRRDYHLLANGSLS